MSGAPPTAEEIGYWGALDADLALKQFLGKSVEQIEEELSCSEPCYYAEALGVAGPVAFCYYLPALTWYMAERAGPEDELSLSSFLGAVYEQFTAMGHPVCTVEVRRLAETVLVNFRRYRPDEDHWGPIKGAYELLLTDLEAHSAGGEVDWAGRRFWWLHTR